MIGDNLLFQNINWYLLGVKNTLSHTHKTGSWRLSLEKLFPETFQGKAFFF